MPGLDYRDSTFETLQGADATVLVTEWEEFVGLDWSEVQAR